ncbi:MAG: hypothetical protein B7Y90_07825 [Alphaproteobacteria bacterium 32-64-14]|nr:MAG: hypothetical protein B7Y90_07825 [Alphaproteobacteria bacterium 32-64-14]
MSMKLVSVAALGLALAGCASNPPPRDLGRLAFMVGCWTSPPPVPAGQNLNLESWSPSESGLMFGYATTVKDGNLVTWEQSRIDLKSPRATYTASPEGQRAVIFVEVPQPPPAEGAPAPLPSVTFENGDHDYPQRIRYYKTEAGLAASISKLDGSRPFNYSWVRCKY